MIVLLERLCLEDWIAERELFVPIAVGGFLAVLLAIVLTAYIIAFIRRRVIEKKGVRYSKIDQ